MAHSKLIIHNSDKSFQLDMFYITTSTILVPIEILQTYHYREFQMFQMSLNSPSDERLLFCFAHICYKPSYWWIASYIAIYLVLVYSYFPSRLALLNNTCWHALQSWKMPQLSLIFYQSNMFMHSSEVYWIVNWSKTLGIFLPLSPDTTAINGIPLDTYLSSANSAMTRDQTWNLYIMWDFVPSLARMFIDMVCSFLYSLVHNSPPIKVGGRKTAAWQAQTWKILPVDLLTCGANIWRGIPDPVQAFCRNSIG